MDTETISTGMKALCLVDKDIEKAFMTSGLPSPRVSHRGFETFLFTIVSQQLSIKVAKVISKRVFDLLQEVTPDRVMAVSDQELRDAGLSWRKIEYAKGLAQAVLRGEFDIEKLETMDNEHAIQSITNLRGFGRWSAEIYLMFSLNRKDVFPADDLGLLIALGQIKGLADKPTPKQAREIIEHWSPWRSVGALFLWQYYHQPKEMNKG